jgi:hypothetical protein
MSAQTSRLVRDEMRPAQQGFQQSAKRAGIGGGLIGIAGLLLIFAFAADVAVIIAALALVLPVWAAVLIAAAVLLAVAGIAALINQQARGSARVPPATASCERFMDYSPWCSELLEPWSAWCSA